MGKRFSALSRVSLKESNECFCPLFFFPSVRIPVCVGINRCTGL